MRGMESICYCYFSYRFQLYVVRMLNGWNWFEGLRFARQIFLLQDKLADIESQKQVLRQPGSSKSQSSSRFQEGYSISIKCEDPRCNVWQHIACVIIPEKPMEGILPAPPPVFYCELCRLARADPFWITIVHPLPPVKLIMANPPTDETNLMPSLEKTFHFTRDDGEMLAKPEYDLQV